MAVLHTHSRRLDYHPHVHLAMPAAALDTEKRLWRTKTPQRQRQRLPVQPSRPGQGVSGQGAGGAQPGGVATAAGVPAKWVVDCKGVGDGEKALVYLGRYLYRGVIQEKDILSCDNGQVRFRYRDSKTGKSAVRTVSGAAFLRLILQHVLPKGFRRARNFGFLHPNSKRLIALLQVVLKVIPERRPDLDEAASAVSVPMLWCADAGACDDEFRRRRLASTTRRRLDRGGARVSTARPARPRSAYRRHGCARPKIGGNAADLSAVTAQSDRRAVAMTVCDPASTGLSSGESP